MVNNVPKRVDAEKEAGRAENVMRKDKPGRIEKKEFLKYSGNSRLPNPTETLATQAILRKTKA